jgi:hypothetical protein
MQVKSTQHSGSFHSQSDGGVQMQRSNEEQQQQHWPAVTSMSDGGVVLQSPAAPAVAEASLATLPTVGTVTALSTWQAADLDAAAEEIIESHLDEASSTRTSDDSWGTASNACSRAGSLQHRQLSSSVSVTSSLINLKRQSLQDSRQLKGLASYARFAAAGQKQDELQGPQLQIEAAACSASNSVDLSVPTRPSRQPGASVLAVRTGRVTNSSSRTIGRRGSQLSSSCSALAGLDKRQVRAEIAAAGGMAAIVEQFSSGLFEDAGGDSAPGCAAAAAVQSWARQPAASVIDTAASSSVDVVPLDSGASRGTRTKKQTAGCSVSASSGSVLGGDNNCQVYDQVALVQQQQVQKMLRRSQAAASNSNRMGW